jgi:hypothetical protein
VCIALGCLGSAALARAQAPACARDEVALVVLRTEPNVVAVALDEVRRHLAVGLSASGVAVCSEARASQKSVATVVLEQSTMPDELLHIHMQDVLTHKVLERSIDLRTIPADSRGLATALYVEELLQASWAEIALQKRIYLQEHPVQTPPEVKRELDSVLPAPAPDKTRARRLRVSIGGAFSNTQGKLWQSGPDVQLGFATLSWLELSLRIGYRTGPIVTTTNGEIRAQAILGSIFVEPFWRLHERLSLRFPQGLDVSSVMFSPRPNEDGGGAAGSRPAVVITHGAGLRVMLSRLLSITAIGRFVWTLLPAEAEDLSNGLVGVSGVGGEGALGLDTTF